MKLADPSLLKSQCLVDGKWVGEGTRPIANPATGAVLDSTTGLLCITRPQYSKLKSLFFTTGGTTFELTPNAQIWPRVFNELIGGAADKIYLVVNDIGTPTGQGLDFINGYAFLERFYSVFDTGKRRVGLATTPFTTATTN